MDSSTLVVLIIVLIVIAVKATSGGSKSKTPDPAKVGAVMTAAGNLKIVKKVKYVEIKKERKGTVLGTTNMSIKRIKLYAIDGTIIPASALRVVASSTLGAGTPDHVVEYHITSGVWRPSNLLQSGPDWIRVELKEPVPLKSVVITNDVGNPTAGPLPTYPLGEAIVGAQLTVMDVDGQPIYTQIFAQMFDTLSTSIE